MLGSITPLGEGGRGQRWGVTVSFFAAGSLSAGAVVGGALGALGESLGLAGTGPERLVALGLAAGAGAVLDAKIFGLRLPTIRRQVNDSWMYAYRGWVYGLGFGVQLGASVMTVVTTGAVYVALLASFLSASPLLGAMIGLTAGAVRALTLLPGWPVRSQAQLLRLSRALTRWDPLTWRVAIASQAIVAALLLAYVFSTDGLG